MKKWLLLLWLLGGNALADGFKPVMIYDSDLILDKSWNEAIHNGLEKFKAKSGVAVEETVINNVKAFPGKAARYAKNGFSPIMLNNVDAVKGKAIQQIMLDFPKTRFIIFNGSFNVPNAHYFVFSNQESSFLAGFLASRKSRSKKLGFVGGMDIPLIRNFLCGYLKGAKHENPRSEVSYAYLGDDYNAWMNPEKAYQVASAQIVKGADVVFSPSGGSAQGALKAAHDKGVLGIGVDSNQNHLFPGSVLTSTMVRVDNAAFRALMAAQRNIWGEQTKNMGLQENGVELAFDRHNAALVPEALRAELDRLKADIVLGKIKLPAYSPEAKCVVDGVERF